MTSDILSSSSTPENKVKKTITHSKVVTDQIRTRTQAEPLLFVISDQQNRPKLNLNQTQTEPRQTQIETKPNSNRTQTKLKLNPNRI